LRPSVAIVYTCIVTPTQLVTVIFTVTKKVLGQLKQVKGSKKTDKKTYIKTKRQEELS